MKQTNLTVITRQPYARMLRKLRKEFCQGWTIRLTDARRFAGGASTNAFSERTVTYDRNGNILSLTRYGADTAVPEEALAYSYDGNMLVGVSNSGSSGGGGTYAHDANGNLTRDGLSGLDIGYDDLNLTSRISSGDTTLAEYGHLADGTKISSADGSGNGLQYRGSLVYTQTAGQSGSPTLTLDCALTSAGRIVRETTDDGSVSYRPLIHLRDHLGSVRAVIDGDTGTVLEANDYYPFGKRIPTPVTESAVTEPVEVTSNPNPHSAASTGSATSQNRWLFSGKESQSFLSASIPLLDFGARMYDPITARWTAQDPLAEKYYAVSPYAYCSANPVNIVDPDGLAWKPLYYNGEYVGYEWISNDDAYENGQLKDGYYEQAIFFTATGTQGSFNKDSDKNIGTSTAFVYLADGSIMAYNASTYPADLDKFPTVPEGLYEAKVGKHKGSYDALRLSEIGTENFYANRIDLENENPAFSDGRTYAQGINIHKAGKGDLTGGKNTGIYVSQGCLLISRTEWSSFIGHFANKSQRNNIVSVSVSRSVSTPVKYLLPPPIHISIKR